MSARLKIFLKHINFDSIFLKLVKVFHLHFLKSIFTLELVFQSFMYRQRYMILLSENENEM